MSMKLLRPVGRIGEDEMEMGTVIKKRLKNGNMGSAGITVWSKDDMVYATNADSMISANVRPFSLIGIYTYVATAKDIAEDIAEWRKAA